MTVIFFLLYLLLAYATYYNSKKHEGNAYLWTTLGLILPYIGFVISLICFRKKEVIEDKPSFAPLGFRSKKIWKMITASIVYFIFVFTVGVGVFASSDTTQPTPQSNITESNSDRQNQIATSNILAEQSKPVANSGQSEQENTNEIEITTAVNGNLKVHYIDVGQADSILIQQSGKNMLIDAGNNADSNTIINYLKNNGVEKLDIVVATHPHEDHIGAMDEVIKTFDIGTIYSSEGSSTTKTFENFLSAVKTKGLKLTKTAPGTEFALGSAEAIILAPNDGGYEDLNNYSVVIKVTYGTNKFLFEGDAEDISEDEILNKGFDISADVIKIGHHGSTSSSTSKYLDKVSPKYAVISVGKDNSYGHPAATTITTLKNHGIEIYRTDESGTILATSDGTNITFNAVASQSAGIESNSNVNSSSTNSSVSTDNTVVAQTTASSSTENDRIVYYTPGGKSYHFDKNCSTLSRSKTINEGKLSDVIALGKSDPCNKCAGGN